MGYKSYAYAKHQYPVLLENIVVFQKSICRELPKFLFRVRRAAYDLFNLLLLDGHLNKSWVLLIQLSIIYLFKLYTS